MLPAPPWACVLSMIAPHPRVARGLTPAGAGPCAFLLLTVAPVQHSVTGALLAACTSQAARVGPALRPCPDPEG
jgi:hypothetical protein